MKYHSNRGTAQKSTLNNAESTLLYEELTYKIRGAAFEVKKQLGLGHKESVYQHALEKEFELRGLNFSREQSIDICYKDQMVGTYRPDFIVENKVIIELKALPEIGKPQVEQLWSYLKGCDYKLALLVNFGSKDLDIKRIVYDSARVSGSSALSQRESAGVLDQVEYELNLIDTPGHVDFSYEVSRSLAAVEGAILLVDATQGIQAQTLANLELAKKAGLTIIPVINKIDLPESRPEEVAFEIADVLKCELDDILFVSAKTGEGVEELLEAIIKRIPAPQQGTKPYFRALVFDSFYDDYRGVVVYVRVFDGELKKDEKLVFGQQKTASSSSDVGMIQLGLKSVQSLRAGEIGYIVTTFKEVSQARVGETVTKIQDQNASGEIELLPGYKEPQPMVFAEFFTSSGDDYNKLREALSKLSLSDSSISYSPVSSKAFGFGFKIGFLGLLHLEIVKERLEREYDLELIVTTPAVDVRPACSVAATSGREDEGGFEEPFVKAEVIAPKQYLGSLIELFQNHRGEQKGIKHIEEKAVIEYEMPLSEIIINFYDLVKSVTSGYGSLSYELTGYRKSDLVKLDYIISGETFDAFSRMIYKGFVDKIAKNSVLKLKEIIPRQNFEVRIQAAIGAKIIASERIAPFRKDVTEKLYGGDVTRKRKLLEKQKKGKRKMAQVGKIQIPTDVFIKLLKQ
ncbi:MAG: translation elongation factor 4 [bacterium]